MAQPIPQIYPGYEVKVTWVNTTTPKRRNALQEVFTVKP